MQKSDKKVIKIYEKAKTCRRLMPFLQISDLMPADLWFRYLQAVLKNAGLRAKIAENHVLSAKHQIELHRGCSLVYNHLCGPGSPQGENHYEKVCHTLRRVSAGVGLYRRPRR